MTHSGALWKLKLLEETKAGGAGRWYVRQGRKGLLDGGRDDGSEHARARVRGLSSPGAAAPAPGAAPARMAISWSERAQGEGKGWRRRKKGASTYDVFPEGDGGYPNTDQRQGGCVDLELTRGGRGSKIPKI